MGASAKEPGASRRSLGAKLQRAAPWVLLLLAALLPYLNALQCDFVYDDLGQILENPYVAKDTAWWHSLTRPFWPPPHQAGLYRPFTSLTYRLQQGLSDNDPGCFHGLNVLLHLAVTCLVFAVLRRLMGGRTGFPLAVAAVFAAHPIHTEAVTGIVGRSEPLAALFGLAGYLAWLRIAPGTDWTEISRQPPEHVSGNYPKPGGRSRPVPKWHQLACITLCFALAAGSKESAAGWILVVGAHRLGLLADSRSYREAVQERPGMLKRALLGDSAVLLGFLIYILARFAVLGSAIALSDVSKIDNPIFAAPLDIRVLTAGKVLARGIWLMFWPARLSVDYSFDAIALESRWLSLPGLFLIAVIAACIWLLRHKRPAPAAAWSLVFCGGLLLPVSNLLLPIGTIMAERLFYLPSLGVMLLCLAVLHRLLRAVHMQRLGLVILMLAVAALGLRTWDRNHDWQNNLALFEAAVKVQPRSVKNLANLASSLVREDDPAAAEPHYRRALEIAPDYRVALNGLGHVLILQEEYDEAEEILRQSGAMHPRDPEARYRLGNLLLEVGRPQEAHDAFEQVLSIDSHSKEGWIGHASALFMLEDYDASADAWQQAYRVAGWPRELGPHVASALARAGRLAAAIKILKDLLTADPKAADVHHDLALLLLEEEGAGDEGLRAARAAVALAPTARHAETLLRHLTARNLCREAREVLSSAQVKALEDAERDSLHAIVLTACGKAP